MNVHTLPVADLREGCPTDVPYMEQDFLLLLGFLENYDSIWGWRQLSLKVGDYRNHGSATIFF